MSMTPFRAARVALDFNRSVPAALRQLSASGPVCTYGIGPLRATYLFGPEANELVYRNPDVFQWEGGFDTVVPIIGATAPLVSDGADHFRRRGVVQPAFRPNGIDRLLRVMIGRLDAHIDTWQPGDRTNIHDDARSVAHTAAIHGFYPRMAVTADALDADLDVVFRVLHRPLPALLLLQRIPNPIWRRTQATIDRIDQRIAAEIALRRAASAGGDADPEDSGSDDILDMMLTAEIDGTPAMNDQEIRDMVVDLVYANYDTMTSAISFAVHTLWTDPDALQRARAEVCERLGRRAPDLAAVHGLTYLNWVVSETLRLYPPAMMGARRATQPFTFAGHHGRAGDVVIFSPYITHRLPEIWPQPDRFWPERWDRNRSGYQNPGTYDYLPFGVGARRCIAAELSRAEIVATLARLLQRTDLTVVSGPLELGGFAALEPRNGVTVRVNELR
jgi:cytochrome P450